MIMVTLTSWGRLFILSSFGTLPGLFRALLRPLCCWAFRGPTPSFLSSTGLRCQGFLRPLPRVPRGGLSPFFSWTKPEPVNLSGLPHCWPLLFNDSPPGLASSRSLRPVHGVQTFWRDLPNFTPTFQEHNQLIINTVTELLLVHCVVGLYVLGSLWLFPNVPELDRPLVVEASLVLPTRSSYLASSLGALWAFGHWLGPLWLSPVLYGLTLDC